VTRSEEPLLDCVEVCKSYGGVQAVRDVSFRLWPGEILGLVGPNGAGKTTFVDLIGGEQSADAGRILLDGDPLTGRPPRRARRGVARTFQHPQLALDLTVRENIVLGLAARRMRDPWRTGLTLLEGLVRYRTPADDDVAVAVAASLGLSGLERMCTELTLGEMRLVEHARALVQKPSLMLLDEPFAGADAHGVEGVTTALRAILGQGCGIILVDHNVDIVASLVTRIVLMNLGAVVFDGDPAVCLASPEMQSVYFGSAGRPS
jgi:branched-chain amino acid transport system ATP-binding protein